jgi:hypothetical protein
MQSFINGDENGVKWAFWRLAKLGDVDFSAFTYVAGFLRVIYLEL